jgi:hypothetical protein
LVKESNGYHGRNDIFAYGNDEENAKARTRSNGRILKWIIDASMCTVMTN